MRIILLSGNFMMKTVKNFILKILELYGDLLLFLAFYDTDYSEKRRLAKEIRKRENNKHIKNEFR